MMNLIHLDQQLEQFSKHAPADSPVFNTCKLDQSRLASNLATDIKQVLIYALMEWPEIIQELNSPISVHQRYDALVGYFHLMQRGDPKDPIYLRSKIITQLYFDLIYFRERVIDLLRRKIAEQHNHFGKAPYLAEWVEITGDNVFSQRLKALRNGFAHGKWEFSQDYDGIICYPELIEPYNKYEFSQSELEIIHVLVYAFIVVLFHVAVNEKVL